MSAVTDWFPGHIKPARIGAYEGEFLGDGEWQSGDGDFCWTGASWRYRYNKGGSVGVWIDLRLVIKQGRLRWRGLASDPTAPAKPKREPLSVLCWAHAKGDRITWIGQPYAPRATLRELRYPGERVIRVRVTEV